MTADREQTRRDAPLGTVYFDDTGEKRDIVRLCRVCGVTQDELPTVVVSPRGTAHHSSGINDGDTDCGQDGTRDRWWWPL